MPRDGVPASYDLSAELVQKVRSQPKQKSDRVGQCFSALKCLGAFGRVGRPGVCVSVSCGCSYKTRGFSSGHSGEVYLKATPICDRNVGPMSVSPFLSFRRQVVMWVSRVGYVVGRGNIFRQAVCKA